nr:pre-mrna-splicing factor 18 [Quercus suber]
MDFASLMQLQIASKSSNVQDNNSAGKKYLKRSELEAQRQAEYQLEQEALETARLERLEKKRKRDDEEATRSAAREAKRKRLAEESRRAAEEEAKSAEAARRKRLGLPLLEEQNSSEAIDKGEEDVQDDVLITNLRHMGEPTVLFGENHVQRLRRWRKLINKTLAKPLSNGPIPTILELVEEKDMKVPSSLPKDEEAKLYLRRQLASYFDMVLSEWQQALARRPTEVKTSSTGRQALNSHLSALENLRPLFQKLETSSLPDTLLAPILEIVDLAQKTRYVDANDAYLRLSIGKAAWPIGVTMVGIHERSAREKLHESDKDGGKEAHILADETTRKMLQGELSKALSSVLRRESLYLSKRAGRGESSIEHFLILSSDQCRSRKAEPHRRNLVRSRTGSISSKVRSALSHEISIQDIMTTSSGTELEKREMQALRQTEKRDKDITGILVLGSICRFGLLVILL